MKKAFNVVVALVLMVLVMAVFAGPALAASTDAGVTACWGNACSGDSKRM